MSLLPNSKNNRCSNPLAALTLVAAVVLTGCGADSSNEAVATTSSSASSATAAATAISETSASAATAAATAISEPSASSADGAQATGACRLITGAEAETALGKPIQPFKNTDLGAQNGFTHDKCFYGATDFEGGIVVQLFTGDRAVGDFAQQQITYANKTTLVSGVGDEAFQLSSDVTGPGVGELHVRVGSNQVEIQLNLDSPDLDARLLELGKAAAGRL